MLFILDKNLDVVDNLSNLGSITSITPFFSDEFKQFLENGAEIFKFETLANTTESQHLVVGNFVAFMYEKKYKLFHIVEIEEIHNEDFVKAVYCEMAGIELINEIIRPVNITSASITKFLETILGDTEWELGEIDLGLAEVRDINITEYTPVYSLLQEYIPKIYGGELSFSVDIQGGTLIGKYINVYEKRGNEEGFRFEYSSNISSITRTVDTTNLATALVGVGTNGITFKSVVADDKPLNQDFIIDEEAYQRWSRNGSHILGIFKTETSSPQELLKLTRLELENRKEPKVKYELKTELLSRSDVGIGDTVLVVDHEFNPPIYLEARVSELTTSFSDPSKNECVLSNFKEVITNITESMRAIASKLHYVEQQTLDMKSNVVYKIEISSSNGLVFNNGNISTTLTATVYYGQKDVSNELSAASYVWKKYDKNGNLDTMWTQYHAGCGRTITITKDDVLKKSDFKCEIDVSAG